jgi:hypothetical protein
MHHVGSTLGILVKLFPADAAYASWAAHPEISFIVTQYTIDFVAEQSSVRLVRSKLAILITCKATLWRANPEAPLSIIINGADPVPS